jgi:hypothetical protein
MSSREQSRFGIAVLRRRLAEQPENPATEVCRREGSIRDIDTAQTPGEPSLDHAKEQRLADSRGSCQHDRTLSVQ